MTHSIEVLLNEFAIRSFRDMADRDYIHARIAYKSMLVPQFQWSALHCLEKYAKGILLINRIKSQGIKHEVRKSLDLVRAQGRFEIKLSDKVLDFIRRLEGGAEFRYFEVSYWSEYFEIVRLDGAVSELRRYCQVLDWEVEHEGSKQNFLQPMLNRIEYAASSKPRDTCILSGWLEQVLAKKDHPAREALVWQNLFFGFSNRNRVKLVGYMEAGNSPLYMHPEILDEVTKYVYLPKRVVNEWKQEILQRNQPSQ